MEFYKETRFKNSEIGEVPEDWDVVRLVDYVNVLKGFAFSSKFFNENGEGIPIIRIRDLGKDKTEAYYSGQYDSIYIVELGDLLVSMDGEFDVYIWKGPKGLLNQRVCKIWTKDTTKLDNLYLYYALKKPLKLIEAQTSQTTVKHLLDKDIKRIKIPLPPLEEQKKIAEVLSKTDEAIQKVDESIEKFEKLKKGLMNILLNGKVRVKVENGKIYFYKETRFKKSEVGEVPEDWEVVRLGDEGYFKIIMGQSPPSSTYNENKNGLPFLQGCAEFEEIYPKPQLYTSKPLKIAEDGDLLISVRAPVGEINITPFKLCIGRGLAAIRPNNEKVNKFFIFYYLKMIRSKLEQLGKGSTFKAITKNDLENLKIPLPPLEEQKAIAEILSKIDKVIQLKKEKKEKLQKIKKYFMDNLLTGKVRIKL